jgi:hypothetical protein
MQRMSSSLWIALGSLLLTAAGSTAAVINVSAGENLQAALDQAQPGDTIVLQAGARFTGQFRFPAKTGTVTLTSSGPLPDRRITEDDGSLMATIASGSGAMALDMHNSAHWVIDGIRFEPNVGGFGEVIAIDGASHIELRRLLLVVPEGQEQKRFVLGNGRHITLTQSHCAGVWRSGQDSQCFVAWDGAGPYTITDNFLEAAGENVMFGGEDSSAPDAVPADILVENNFFSKRLEWKGQPRGVKNLFELKAGRRVIVRHNVFERNWVDAQPGAAILFTPRNQNGGAPWTSIEDVLFEHNIVRDTPTHFNILGFDNNAVTAQTTRIVIRHNLLLGSGGGRLALIGNEVGDLEFSHNTYVNPQTAEAAMMTLYAEGSIPEGSGSRASSYAVSALTFADNLVQFNTYGLHSAVGLGTNALTAMTQRYTWANNVLAGGFGKYPPTTTFIPADEYPTHLDAEYFLVPTSSFKSMATDGTDIGWNRLADPDPDPDPVPVAIDGNAPPNGRVTVSYSSQLSAAGGSGSYVWTIEAGGLPDGLTLNATTGAIAGTPTHAGSHTFTVRATDASDAQNSADAAYTLEINPAISISTTVLPGGVRARAYSAQLSAADNVGAFTWSIVSGALPTGLTLDPSTGVISGKPNRPGTFNFTVAVRDAQTSASRAFSIRIANK